MTTDNSNTTSYFNKETDVSILVPKTWSAAVLDENSFRLFGEAEPGFEEFFDEYRPTISFEKINNEFPGLADMKRFVAASNEEMAGDYNAYRVLSEEWKEIAKKEAYLKHYEWTEEETQITVTQIQAFIRMNPYFIILVNAAVFKPLRDKYIPAFEAILDSMRIIPA